MKKLYFITISISMFFIILISSLLISTYNKDFYINQFHKNNTYSNEMVISRNIKPETIAYEVISYLKGDIKDLNRHGFFSREEILHMNDVKKLFTFSKYLLGLFILIFILSLYVYIKKRGNLPKLLYKVPQYFVITSIIIFTLLYVAFLNFSQSFTLFHEILFTNDYWLLDPRTSIIINIMPEEFFFSHTLNIGKYILALSFIFIASMLSLSYFIKNKFKEEN